MPAPQAVLCHLCNGKYFKHSLPIHLKQCEKKWKQTHSRCEYCGSTVANSDWSLDTFLRVSIGVISVARFCLKSQTTLYGFWFISLMAQVITDNIAIQENSIKEESKDFQKMSNYQLQYQIKRCV